jgi:hypothetical protein
MARHPAARYFQQLARTARQRFRRARYHLFFPRVPAPGRYCNSKSVRRENSLRPDETTRPYLVFIRLGISHRLALDDAQRNFDIALNCYGSPDESVRGNCEYLSVGGLNKYMAAREVLLPDLYRRYRGVVFLDDDVEVRASELTRFFAYCDAHAFELAQPSLTRDSHTWHRHLVNQKDFGWRSVRIVEVMCPYFSKAALEKLLSTFELSYSTWGLDYLWPGLLDSEPVVVDEFTVRHAGPVEVKSGPFYRYLQSIGVSPQDELEKLKRIAETEIS